MPPRTLKKTTLAEFREAYNHSGESVISLAEIATQTVSDDDEFVQAAKAAVEAEDKFFRLLGERGINL